MIQTIGLLSVLLILSLNCKAMSRDDIHITDVAFQFVPFWDRTKDLPMSERILQFRKQIVQRAPQLYQDNLFRHWQEVEHENVDERIANQLKMFPKIRVRYEEVYRLLILHMVDYLVDFHQQFSDFDLDNTDVYLAHSLGSSKAASMQLNHRTQFYLGVDMITVDKNDPNLEDFIYRELFHVYHSKKYKLTKQFYSQLWCEGLALYTAKDLHFTPTNAQLHLDDQLIAKTQAKQAELATEIGEILEISDPQLNSKYFNIDSKDEAIPPQCGCYIGYLAVKELAQNTSVLELTNWQSEQILPRLRAALKVVAKKGQHVSSP